MSITDGINLRSLINRLDVRKGSDRERFPIWEVRVYLGEQCDWGIVGVVTARTESEAIAEGRQVIALAWPGIYLAGDLGTTPATARVVSL